MKKGKFITIYGVNNIGKSTQAKKLVEHLKEVGYEAVYLKYPIYDLEPTGPQLNEILRQSQAQPLQEEVLQSIFKQNRQDFQPQLEAMLQEGKIVVAEDYSGTGIAWGTAKGLDLAWIEKLNQDLRKEDLAILLRGKRHLKARELQHLHEQDDQLVAKVDTVLLELAQTYGWKIIETNARIDKTAEVLAEVVNEFLKKG